MILQLKITLKGSKPPIWRRIEVRDTMTFYELHQVIQIAFEWNNYHLHGFDIRKTNSIQMNDFHHSIGPMDIEAFDFSDFAYDEKEVRLKEVFKKEKDRVWYTYDFGDEWRHDIVLEKKLQEQPDAFYPRCTKAMRETPEEDSRYLYLETGIQTEPGDPTELMKRINEDFHDVFRHIRPQAGGQNEAENSWTSLLNAAEEYKKVQPWKWLDDDQIFAVQDPETGEFIYCSIMGGRGIEYGLAAFIGEDGREYIKGLAANREIDEIDYFKQRSLLLSFSSRDELSKEDYQLLKEHGRSYRGKNQWPQFRSFEPGYYPWYLNEAEVQLFTEVIKQVIDVGLLAKDNPEILMMDHGMFARINEHGTWKNARLLEQHQGKGTEEIPLFVSEVQLQEIKRSLKRKNISIEFDCDFVLTPIQKNPNDRPYLPRLVLCVERKNGLVVYYNMMENTNVEEEIQASIISLMKEIGGIPREIWVKEEFSKYIRPIARKLNIQLLKVQKLPFIQEVRRGMESMLIK